MNSMKEKNGFKISTNRFGILSSKTIYTLSSSIFNEKMAFEQLSIRLFQEN